MTTFASPANGQAETQAGEGISVKWQLVTPTLAEAMLERNISHNRTVRQHVVEKYAADMKAGKWRKNADTIKFGKTGELLDGQHRLWAVSVSGKAQEFLIAYNIEVSAFETIDIGARRTPGDHMTFSGFQGGNLLASACKLLYQYDMNDYGGASKIPLSTIMGTVREHPDIQECQKMSKKLFKATKMNSTAATVFLYLASRHPALTEFVNGLVTGANLSTGDPRLALRNYFQTVEKSRSIERGSTRQRKLHLYAAITAFNDFVGGRQRLQFKNTNLDTAIKPRIPGSPVQ